MTGLFQDARYAARTLAKSPVFTAGAILILALGVGFNTAVFSLVDAVVLRPLPEVARPGELWSLTAGKYAAFSYPSYSDLRANPIFSGLAASGNRSVGISGRDSAAERVSATVVSANYFDVLGVRPRAGRFFRPGEERSGEAVAVLSHGLWQRRFGGSASAVGSTISINATPFTVVGVAPPGFRGTGFASPGDVWMPVGAWPRVATGALARLSYDRRNWSWMSVFGRLAPGISPAAAGRALEIAASQERRVYPRDTGEEYAIALQPLSRVAAGAGHPADPVRFLSLLMGAVGVALLAACANLANLLHARAAARSREIAVRRALGAGRGRLVRQRLTESLALALAGGGAGIFVAHWSLTLAGHIQLPGEVRMSAFSPSLDPRVLFFALALSAATGILFGLLPALRTTRVPVFAALKDEQAAARRRAALPGALVAAQVALCLVLLASGGLLARSLRNALATDPGFQPRGVALAEVHLGPARYDGTRAWSFAVEAVRAAGSMPGAKSAAWAGMLPLSGDQDVESLELPDAPAGRKLEVGVTAVGPGYFRTLALPLVAGREFQESDAPEGNPVVVVNEAAAKRFWPGRDAVGRRIRIAGAERTVVGVSRDCLFDSFRDPHVPQVALAIQQLRGDGVLAPMALLVRVSGDPRAASAAVRERIARMDASLPVFGPSTLEDSIAGQLLPQRVGSALVGLFAILTLALSALGIYAVVAGSVARRVREIGIRTALGAQPGQLRRMILAQSAAPVAAGLLLGLPLAFAASRALSGFLFGVTSTDAATFLAAALVLALAAAAAADLPARRATRIDPMAALRND